MFVYLLTASILAFPVCIAFSSDEGVAGDAVRPWFAGLGAGVPLVLVETLLRFFVELDFASPVLFAQLAVTETTVPVGIAVGFFYAFSRRIRSAEPIAQELGMAAFLSGSFTTRALYHALYIADSANLYWSFLSPTLMVGSVFLVPTMIKTIRRSFGWSLVLMVGALLVVLVGFTVVPLLHYLHFHTLSVAAAGVVGVGGLGAWVLRPLVRAHLGSRIS